jgi:phage shock protein PspC (stress-responsive transcriptional regulator)
VFPRCATGAARRILYIVSATQGPSGAARIEDTVKDFWATRPRRPRRGRKVAGVAAGIANRYRIDPVLVRVGFVVAAIYGGAGVLAYLLGWLFLPEQDDQVSPVEALFGKGRSSTSSGFTVLLGIITVPVAGWFFSGSFTGEFSSWLSLLVVGALLFLLHQARGHVAPVDPAAQAAPEPPPAPTMPVPPMYPQPPVPPTAPHPANESYVAPQPTQPFAPPPPPHAAEPRTTPPAWDPLGAAPFAWDLPEPATPEPEEPEPPQKRRKPKVGTATLGIALVAAAGLALAGSAAWGNGGWISPQHVIGVVLAIIGLGLVAGAFLKAGRGLIALAVPLSVAGMAMTAISPHGYHGLGDLSESPASVSAVLPLYERSVGSVTLDLTRLPETSDMAVITEVRTDVGSVTVLVPQTANVTVKCSADTGSVTCLDRESNGIDSKIDTFTDLGSDNSPAGVDIELEAIADIGDVEVRRG